MKGCLYTIVGFFGLMIVLGLMLSLASGSRSPQELEASRNQRDAERQARNEQRAVEAEARRMEKESRFAALAEREEEFTEIIQTLIREGVFRSVRFGTVTRVEVRPLFYSMDFETKQQACQIVRALAMVKQNDDMIVVRLMDAQNGQEVGSYDGVRLRMSR